MVRGGGRAGPPGVGTGPGTAQSARTRSSPLAWPVAPPRQSGGRVTQRQKLWVSRRGSTRSTTLACLMAARGEVGGIDTNLEQGSDIRNGVALGIASPPPDGGDHEHRGSNPPDRP